MQLTGIDLEFWAVGFFAHIALLVVLWTRHRATVFPFFTALITSNAIRTIVLYFIHRRGDEHAYVIAYAILAVLDLALQFCVVYEMASHVFRPLGKWAPDARSGLIGIAYVSIAIALGLTWLSALPSAHSLLRTMLTRGNFFSASLMTELFVGMIALSVTVGLPWKTHVARISQGLGFYSLICIVIEGGHSYFGTASDAGISAILSYLRMTSYLIIVGYWIVTLWQDAPAPRELPEAMRMQLYSLQRRVECDLQKLRTWGR